MDCNRRRLSCSRSWVRSRSPISSSRHDGLQLPVRSDREVSARMTRRMANEAMLIKSTRNSRSLPTLPRWAAIAGPSCGTARIQHAQVRKALHRAHLPHHADDRVLMPQTPAHPTDQQPHGRHQDRGRPRNAQKHRLGKAAATRRKQGRVTTVNRISAGPNQRARVIPRAVNATATAVPTARQ